MLDPNPYQDLSFDPEQVTAVGHAYDLACQTLQNIGQLEVDRENHCWKNSAGRRERRADVNRLCERAIHGLTASDYRQHQA
jgi:hypothetical protein